MGQAKDGDTVRIHYTGRLGDGTVFDTSENRDPLEFKIGGGQVIPGFEDGVKGMEPGNKKTINIDVDNAYGQRRDEMMVSVEKSNFPPDIEPVEGQQLQLRQQDGSVVNVLVAKVEEETVVLDANHPLAGKDLIFDLELVEIV